MAKTINKLEVLKIKADVDKAKAGEQAVKVRKLPDGGGLYLWVHDDGRAYWRFRYYVSGKEKSLSLGTYQDVTLADARKKAKEAGEQADPSAARQADNRVNKLVALNTFEAVARDWHSLQAGRQVWSERHAKAILNLLEADLFPDLGKRPISQITPLELFDTLRKIEQRGAVDTAHRALRHCIQIYGHAMIHAATTGCTTNTALTLKAGNMLAQHKVQNQPAVGGKELCKLLADIDGYGGERQTILALRLLALTFVRTAELIAATWGEFDLDGAVWTAPAARMKMDRDHLVPLSQQALDILAELKKAKSHSKFILPGRNALKPISVNTMLFALYRLGYKGKQTGHGFRAIASTILNEVSPWKDRPDVIEMQLAHVQSNKTRSAYNRAAFWDERVAMMQWWGDYLDEVRKGAKVLPFGRAA